MNTNDYAQLLDGIKARVRSARLRAAAAVNSELVQLYWNVGRDILKWQREQGWGAKVVDRVLQSPIAKLTWTKNVALLDRLKKTEEREWYARETLKHGWDCKDLIRQIKSGLYERQGKALTNFSRTLPPEQSDLAREILKDPYDLEFLGLTDDAYAELLDHIKARVRSGDCVRRPRSTPNLCWFTKLNWPEEAIVQTMSAQLMRSHKTAGARMSLTHCDL